MGNGEGREVGRGRSGGFRVARWSVAVTLLVPIVMPFLVAQVRALDGHPGAPSARWALPLCEAILLIGVSGPVSALWLAARARTSGGEPARRAAAVWGAFAAVCLVGALTGILNGLTGGPGGLTDARDDLIGGGVLVVLGVASALGVVTWHRHRRSTDRGRQRLSPSGSPAAVAPPPSDAPRVAGGSGGAGADRGWWTGAVVGVAVAALLLLVPPAGIVPQLRAHLDGVGPTIPVWALAADVVILLLWCAGTAAFLQTPREAKDWPDPRDQLDPAERRALLAAVREDRPVDPSLRPVLRAHLLRELHHGRRRLWICLALSLQALDEGVDALAGHAVEHPTGTTRIIVGGLGLLVLPLALRGRRRAARRLEALEPGGEPLRG